MTSTESQASPSDHLLRTLAAVPVSSQMLVLGCGAGRQTEALLRLGFPVHACDPHPQTVEEVRSRVRDLIGDETVQNCVQEASLDSLDYPEASFDWVVADRAEVFIKSDEDLGVLFEHSRRLLTPGGWLYVSVPGVGDSEESSSSGDEEGGTDGKNSPRFTVERVEEHRTKANLKEASPPNLVQEQGGPRVRAIYRRVEPHTPA